ncbi:MAG: hypothetical protein EHJ95_00600 [Methanobacteriota archaeon]|nr:MAG: hypothetical protein EHJ95_00600 [Euryarchaeota archaeon]
MNDTLDGSLDCCIGGGIGVRECPEKAVAMESGTVVGTSFTSFLLFSFFKMHCDWIFLYKCGRRLTIDASVFALNLRGRGRYPLPFTPPPF